MIKDLLPSDPVVVGPYQLVGRLGRGGMGQVFLGRSPGGRRVAVKVIRPELADDVEFRARFAREVAAARGVSGMFTALVIDADTGADQPWLATAYVPGPSLAEAVSTEGPLPARTVLGLAAGLAEGLQAIHQAGVVHRDLKPSNVLLAADGPRVIDFGISRAHEASMLTMSGVIVGTPGYLSPEQAKARTVGPPSDIFSLGGVLTYAATGQGPFGSGPADAMVYRVVELEPELSGVAAELRPIVARCLAKDPAARPTAAELLAELDNLGLDTGVAALEWLPAAIADSVAGYSPTDQVSPQDGGPPSPWVRHRRLILASMAAVILVTGLGVGAGLSLSNGVGKASGGPTPSVVAVADGASATGDRTSVPARSPSASRSAAHKQTSTHKPTASHAPTHHAVTPARTPTAVPGTTPPVNSSLVATAGSTQAATSATPIGAAPTTKEPNRKPSPAPTTPAAPAPQEVSGVSGATSLGCSEQGAVGTVPGGTGVSYAFVNDSQADIQVYYLASNDNQELYDTIAPGSQYAPSAATDQYWMIGSASGGCLGIFRINTSGEVSVS